MSESKTLCNKRGQAAIFDGIMFLLIASFSCALVFSFIQGYGQSEDNAMRSSYELNVLQSVMKTVYYLDAETLVNINSGGLSVYQKDPSLDLDNGCKKLINYKGFSVVDLFKKDLADYPTEAAREPRLNDYFNGSTGKGPFVPGRTGMRCAMKELMKPITLAGYDYFVEVIDPGSAPADKAIPADGARITNNASLADDPKAVTSDKGSGCDAVQQANLRILSMAAPFRVPVGSATRDYEMRLCVWQRP